MFFLDISNSLLLILIQFVVYNIIQELHFLSEISANINSIYAFHVQTYCGWGKLFQVVCIMPQYISAVKIGVLYLKIERIEPGSGRKTKSQHYQFSSC